MAHANQPKGYEVQVLVRGAWSTWRTYQPNGRGHCTKEVARLRRLGHHVQVQGLLVKPEARR